MFTSHIDLGQVVIVGVLGVIGWFIKHELTRINNKIDEHDTLLFSMNGKISELTGMYGRRKMDKI